MNEIRFKPEVSDLIAAQQLYQLVGLKRMPPFLLAGFVAVPLIVWMIDGNIDWRAMSLAFATILALIAVLVGLVRYLTIPRAARKTFRLDKAFASDIVVNWDQENLQFLHSRGQWEASIGDFAAAIADRDSLLLFRQTNMFHFLPTRAFASSAERDELLSLLRSHGVSARWPPK